MKLYYTPAACSLAVHIVLHEAGFEFEKEAVDLKTKKTETGKDFTAISKKSATPYLILDNNEGLSEGVAINQYLADLKPESNLAPKPGSFERVRLNEWLSFISTELHKSFFPFFANLNDEAKAAYREKLKKSFGFAAENIKGPYVMGEHFTIADAYLYTIATWLKFAELDTNAWPKLAEFMKKVESRPKVKEVLEAEAAANKAAA